MANVSIRSRRAVELVGGLIGEQRAPAVNLVLRLVEVSFGAGVDRRQSWRAISIV